MKVVGARGVGHWVKTRGTERTTTKKTAGRQPQPSTGTVQLQGFQGIGGARRGEPTRRGMTLAGTLVRRDPRNNPARSTARSGSGIVVEGSRHAIATFSLHKRTILSTSAARSVLDRVAALGLAPMTKYPAGNWLSRVFTSARRRRFMRFRATADPKDRPRAYPTCGPARVDSRTMVHDNRPDRTCTPSRRTRSNVLRL